jgi:peptidoglycan/xylan/chitin deacetylase (PgdA/CDA1 family)
MSRYGILFQSHTRTHSDLTRMTEAAVLDELAGSRLEIEDRLGVAVDAVAYPFGSYDARVLALAERAGYQCGWAAGLAPAGPYSRERFQVTSADGIGAFAVKVGGWGGWLRRAGAALRPGRAAGAHVRRPFEVG